ncbi:hypothetical protein ACFLTE_02945 [Bacteroidota bacterium]
MKNKNRIFLYITFLVIGIVIGYLINTLGITETTISWTYGDSKLEIDLKEDMEDSETFLEKLFSTEFSKEGTIGWLKHNKGLYKATDIDLANEIEKLTVDEPISEQLRKISQQRKGPWTYHIDTILIGVPPIVNQPKEGFANVCETGDYLGQKLKVYDINQRNSIEVFATGRYECPSELKYPDLQLSAKDAEKLLGTSEFLKYETAIILIMNE